MEPPRAKANVAIPKAFLKPRRAVQNDNEWTEIRTKEQERQYRLKVLVCPDEDVYAKARESADNVTLVAMPDGSIRVPGKLPTSLDVRCRTMLPTM